MDGWKVRILLPAGWVEFNSLGIKVKQPHNSIEQIKNLLSSSKQVQEHTTVLPPLVTSSMWLEGLMDWTTSTVSEALTL